MARVEYFERPKSLLLFITKYNKYRTAFEIKKIMHNCFAFDIACMVMTKNCNSEASQILNIFFILPNHRIREQLYSQIFPFDPYHSVASSIRPYQYISPAPRVVNGFANVIIISQVTPPDAPHITLIAQYPSDYTIRTDNKITRQHQPVLRDVLF